ncbi:hypothetical protein [Crossiella cryophila]|uniref:Uncharacterized protein n=1 Tax=Crossiella cryophila TaxID=43355 RepID=A0A7W7FRW8_9PSEU|nr:hypothetical protein [Crossiella cryophila]MBB4675350.1 hypothetical protein [Crossiella cryophila]
MVYLLLLAVLAVVGFFGLVLLAWLLSHLPDLLGGFSGSECGGHRWC